MNNPLSNLRTTIQLTVVAVFLLATLLTAALAIGLQYHFGQALAREAATDSYGLAADAIRAELLSIERVNNNVLDLLAGNPLLTGSRMDEKQLRLFIGVLEKNPLFYGVYLGRADGSFFEVVNLDASDSGRRVLRAMPADRWLVITLEGAGPSRTRHFRYLDARLQLRVSRSEPTDFDPATRPWYRNAMASDSMVATAPYLFAQLGIPGRTLSRRVGDSDAVVAIDMTLETMAAYLEKHRPSTAAEIYLYDSDGQVIASSVAAAGSATLPTADLVRAAATPALHGKLLEVPLRGSPWLAYSAPAKRMGDAPLYLGILVPLDSVVQPFLDRVKLSIAITTGVLLLLLPLSWVFARPIVKPVRQLALENDKVRRREFDSVVRVKSRVRELDELSESMVNMVSAIRAYEQAQRELMDAIIRLIAQAIDDKSAYTGGHCERVPQLALMLAEAANDSDLPAFRDFRFESEDARHEFRIAAWLHDCGKITTPEHIVDKGSKLETIYNRIHEVRMRFEVLWRDAEIDHLRRLHERADEPDALAAELRRRQAQLQEEFAFVARCNVGGESLDDADIDRLHRIATTTWVRYFSDRIGLSPTEEQRLPPGEEVLPATERLLSDKPHHIIKRSGTTEYPARWGIHMDIPEHLYNLGEIYNLCISRGTLTPEDRFKINEHMIATIRMLDSLPFPDELKQVPRYASTHHETMGGTGYPRRLTGDKLSVPERLLAVADVFEALTASDRPYKKAKSIGEALDILYRMVLDRHIDRDCFELFISEKIYLRYAHRFLLPEQIDRPDTGRYLRSVSG